MWFESRIARDGENKTLMKISERIAIVKISDTEGYALCLRHLRYLPTFRGKF